MKKEKEIASIIKEHWFKKTNAEIGEMVGLSATAVRGRGKRMRLPPKPNNYRSDQASNKISIEEQIALDKEKKDLEKQKTQAKKKYEFLLEESEKYRDLYEASIQLKENISPIVYEYKPLSNDTESVAVVLASDWHIEERVKPETVNGLNNFGIKIARTRVEQFFVNTLKLVEKEQNATKIDTLVLALLGDFISGNIHEELLENCELPPIEAMIEVENMIIGGIQYLLDHSELKLIIPCHVGNHTRITKKVHIATEAGNSLETIMYHHIKNHFNGNPRVEVLISPSYLSYLDLWGYTICFSHGHAVKYGGGVGGLTIPLRKAVAQWQKTRRADLYCIGHWHQFLDIGEAIVNGSLVGYNAFALFIKAEYERPVQTFFLINKRYNRKTVVCPILFNS